MTKNVDAGDNTMGNLTNHESEKTSDSKIPKQKPENRETPDDSLQHATGKKVRNYFFEFLMVFLAVFCGFIAENWRGQLQEHQRENVFIRSIVEDLKSDTLQSGKVLMQLRMTSTGIDSVLNALSSPEIIKNSNNAYRLWTKNLDIRAFVSNDRTIQQLKNSGELRLIRNEAVSDGIMKYDQTVRNYYQQSNFMYGALSNQRIFLQLFDFISLRKNMNVPVPLTEQGKGLLNQAYGHIQLWNYGLMGLISWLEGVHEDGKRLLVFIQKEYHVE